MSQNLGSTNPREDRKNLPAIADLHLALAYDPETGLIKWRVGPRAGQLAGYLTQKGYRHLTVMGVEMAAHRVAWALSKGAWPTQLIDHANGDKQDNRIENLRECSPSENAQNTAAKRLRFLPTGVLKHSRGAGFNARIVVDGKCHYLGYFPTAEAAHAAYLAAKERLHTFQPVPREPPII